MRTRTICVIGLLLVAGMASAQDYAEQAKAIKEAADLAAQKSYTKKDAFTGYLNCYRLYEKAGSRYKNERAELLSATSALMADERMLMTRDAAVVDSLLNESYGEFNNDVANYLPLLENYVQKASGIGDKYAHSFELYDRAVAIRKDNDMLKGSEYETLLRWYASHLFYRKDISKEEKFNLHKELWELYQANNPNPKELDIKLLDSYHSACGLEGHEDIRVMLSELKNSYVISHFGKESDEYLKIQETLVSDYGDLSELEDKRGIKGEAAKKEIAARLEEWKLLSQRDEIYDDNAALTFNLLIYSITNTANDTVKARSLATEYKEKIASKLGTECELYIKSLENICSTYESSDAGIIPLLEEKLALEEKIYGKDDYRTQASSMNLSFAYLQNHHLNEAITMTQSSLKDDDYLSLLMLASSQTQYGQLREANETFEKLLNMCANNPEIKGAVGFSSILGSINNFNSLGDIDGMLEFGRKWSMNPAFTFEEQLMVFTNVMGMASLPGRSNDKVIAFADEFVINHAQQMSDMTVSAKVLESKASALYGMLRFDEAANVINHIMSSLSNIPTTSKSDIVKYNTDLEICHIAKRDFRQALTANRHSMEIMRSISGHETSVEYCSACARACLCHDQLGEYSQIIPLANIVVSMENTQKSTLDPLASFEVNNFKALSLFLDKSSVITPLVHAYCNENMYDEAGSFMVAYVKELEQTVKFTLSQLDTDKSMGQYNYLKSTADNLNLVAALQKDDHILAEAVFDYSLLTKQAFLASETQMRKQILESGDQALADKFTNIQNLRNIIQSSEQAGLDISALKEQLQQLETQIREDSKAYGDFTRNLDLRWKDIQSALNESGAVVEFISYPDFRDSRTYLAAVILQKEWEFPQIVPLCCEDDLKSEGVLNGNAIDNLIWKQLLHSFRNAKDIYFSPDGIIYNLAIENSRSDDGYISDNYNIYRISSARQLVKQKVPMGSNAVLYGGITYGLTLEELAAVNNVNTQTSSSRYVPRGAVGEIPYLAGTKSEVNGIELTLARNSNMETIVYTAKDAVENTMKNLNPQSTGILHIATHGFYEPDEHTESNLIINALQSGLEDRMLSRSGLYMAGAQNTLDGETIPDGVDDGILTAQEISSLDLHALGLVTLSACETAMGDIAADGVFGLQRGFKKAGANSILMSLWKVDDAATCKLMTEFYSNWIGKKMTKHDALEAAKRTVRETKGWEDPKYWAAFILLDGLD